MEADPVLQEVGELFTLKKLHEKVTRLEAENKELKHYNAILQTQYTSQQETQADITRTLQANIEEISAQCDEKERTIEQLGKQLEDERQTAKDKLEEERCRWDEQNQHLQERIEDLERQLRDMKEFAEKKDQIEADNASLKRQIQEQEEAHQKEISAFDRKKAVEIDQLKKDMHRNVRETREMLKARTKDQLDATTKRTIMENEQMITELTFQSKETERLLDKNQQLMEENARLRRNLHIHKDLEMELARRTHVYQKLVKKMHQRQQADSQTAESQQLFKDSVESADPVRVVDDLKEQSVEDNSELKRQMQDLTRTLSVVRNEFTQYRRDHATLTQLQDQSTRLVIAALYELKNQRECDPFPPLAYDEHASWQFTTMTPKQKEYFFRVLLEKLNSSMCGSCFPAGPNGSSTASLPHIVKPGHDKHGHDHGTAGFSQFLWSVASSGPGGPGAQPGALAHRKDVRSVAAQTETAVADPCLKDGGLWSAAKPPLTSSVRSWSQRALSVPHEKRVPRRI